MGPTSYFNETCDPVDLTQCPGSRHYLDPCDCRKFYQCDPNQIHMFNLSCKLGEIFITQSICGHPNNAICQTTYPWKRCNVTENRMNQLRLMCEIRVQLDKIQSSGQNTSSINVQLMQTLLPVLGIALVLIVSISSIYYRRNRNKRLRRENEPQLPDTDDSHYSSLQEYNPYSTIQHNPIFNIDRTPLSDYVVTEPADITFERMNRQNGTTQGMNTEDEAMVSSENSSYISVPQSDSTAQLSTMSQPSDDVRESEDRTVSSVNIYNEEMISSEDSYYVYVRRYGSTARLSSMPCADRESADRTIHRVNTQVEENVSSDDSSYLSVRRSGSMYSLSIGSNGPCPHRVTLNTQKRFLPFPGERIPCTTSLTT